MRKLMLVLVLVSGLGGCATYEPVSKDYTGPTAMVGDTGLAEDGSKARMFALMEVDGHRIDNAFAASAYASSGHGAALTPVFPERKVPARPMKVVIRGSHATGAPIQALASQLAGTFFSVEGTVEFNPEADHVYKVKGELSKEKSSVWIEDAHTGQKVTAVISK